MLIALLIIHILISVVLILSIMLQSGQAGGLGGAFGGSGGAGAGGPGQSLFGGRGAADFLGKATRYLGTAFLIISFLLAFVQAHQSSATTGGRNILRDMYDDSGQSEQAPAPAQTPGVTEGEGLLPAGDNTATPVADPVADPAASGGQTETPATSGGEADDPGN